MPLACPEANYELRIFVHIFFHSESLAVCVCVCVCNAQFALASQSRIRHVRLCSQCVRSGCKVESSWIIMMIVFCLFSGQYVECPSTALPISIHSIQSCTQHDRYRRLRFLAAAATIMLRLFPCSYAVIICCFNYKILTSRGTGGCISSLAKRPTLLPKVRTSWR